MPSRKLSSLEVHDIMCKIGEVVVVGVSDALLLLAYLILLTEECVRPRQGHGGKRTPNEP